MKHFTAALRTNDLRELQKIPKSDNHNHGTRGGNIRDFLDDISHLNNKSFNSLDEMQLWYEKNIKYLFQGKEGFMKRIISAFRQAQKDGITRLSLSFGTNDKLFFNNSYYELAKEIQNIHSKTAPKIHFTPEISFSRDMNIRSAERDFDEILETNYFNSIDLVGDDTEPVHDFKKIYKKARKNGFLLRAHLGEFGNADTVLSGIRELDLDEAHHGINAVLSNRAVKYIRDKNLRLNICPSSNVMLNRCHSYSEHPIKKLFLEGIRVSINTDDMLIFDQSVSQEYLNLFNSGTLSAEELNTIRIDSL